MSVIAFASLSERLGFLYSRAGGSQVACFQRGQSIIDGLQLIASGDFCRFPKLIFGILCIALFERLGRLAKMSRRAREDDSFAASPGAQKRHQVADLLW